MIVTAQPFLHELDLLEIKFAELEGIVYKHIVVESTKTFTGIDKPLYFESCAERFERYPVHHVVLDLPGGSMSPWGREKITHLRIAEEVARLNPSIVIYSDADEIPRRSAVYRFMDSELKTARLSMHHLNYFFDRRVNWMGWDFAKIHRFDANGKQPCRSDRDFPLLPDAGWHFQNMIGDGRIMEKLKATSHASDSEANGFTRRIASGELVDIQHTEEFTDLPEFVLQNKDRFHKYFMP